MKGVAAEWFRPGTRVLLGSELAVGMEVTVFDPELDPDGTIAATFADDLVSALRAR